METQRIDLVQLGSGWAWGSEFCGHMPSCPWSGMEVHNIPEIVTLRRVAVMANDVSDPRPHSQLCLEVRYVRTSEFPA